MKRRHSRKSTPRAVVRSTSSGYLVKIGKTTVGRSTDKRASEHLKKELNKSSIKRKAIRKVFRGFHR